MTIDFGFKIIFKRSYKNDKIDDLFIQWNDNGNKNVEGNYKHTKKDGIFKR